MKSTLILILIMLTSLWSFSQNHSSNDSVVDKRYKEVLAIKSQGGFLLVDSWAKYPNGEKGIKELIYNNLKYPEEAVKNKIEGVVTIRYVVQTDGTVDEIEVVKSVDPLLDKEAVRVIGLMEKWKPSIQREEPVKTAYNQDIRFELD